MVIDSDTDSTNR